MTRYFLTLFVALFCCVHAANGQADSNRHLRASLLTVSPGTEIYSTFGHTAIRITDSLAGTDLCFNYGTFNGFEENFELKFMRGKLDYYCSVDQFRDFIYTYQQEERRVEEQELLMPQKNIAEIYEFLRWNARPPNRAYKYDFLFDNCATRIRDAFPKSLGPSFKYGPTGVEGATFRQIINYYLRNLPWERTGINLLLGRQVDRPMSNKDAMFLPDFLRDCLKGATYEGRPVAAPVKVLISESNQPSPGPNYPFYVLLLLSAATIAGLLVPALRPMGAFFSTLILVVTGFLGCLMLFMWLGTDHQACQSNWNVLWALPTNFLLAFRRKGKNRYAVVAIVLLLLSLLLHILKIQELPLATIWPLLLALLVTYGIVYRRGSN